MQRFRVSSLILSNFLVVNHHGLNYPANNRKNYMFWPDSSTWQQNYQPTPLEACLAYQNSIVRKFRWLRRCNASPFFPLQRANHSSSPPRLSWMFWWLSTHHLRLYVWTSPTETPGFPIQTRNDKIIVIFLLPKLPVFGNFSTMFQVKILRRSNLMKSRRWRRYRTRLSIGGITTGHAV